ncbi:MAG: aminoacyl-tRNA hydrolase [Oscillospiraceae bacterium]|nr:aminoacyl-tRNA hydrolase [Oscillospiraceae bacterium]
MGFRHKGAPPDIMIAGLGNPGIQYENTRHNMGFRAVDIAAKRMNIQIVKPRCHAETGIGVFEGKRVLLAKPSTYMNNSGQAVRELIAAFRPASFIVIYDDIDLPPGKLRLRLSGSAGTHNGMRSIIAELGREDFPRIRIGIGKQPPEWDLKDWVLAKADDAELAAGIAKAADAAVEAVVHGFEAAMRMRGGNI